MCSLIATHGEMNRPVGHMRGPIPPKLICIEMNGQQVIFNRGISTPSVTLDGDIFQPSGLLTGVVTSKPPACLFSI
ncbi:hypothetical protein CK203_093795 [Vitis vinifera]|uniref:Uncharacterized protein n=1 Tax=Vitis vinifera TaxID=29760 RepID=A0A438C7X2_VITVI|nr:hypothetical protein CK203_093795 [Vitis vinifera]